MSTKTDSGLFVGYIKTTLDAIRIALAARKGLVSRVVRRLTAEECHSAIQSGTVIVYSVTETGIHRWTDGFVWSSSRIDKNFLIYRETVIPGKGSRRPPTTDAFGRSALDEHTTTIERFRRTEANFKKNGLIKRTITIRLDNIDHHVISYYRMDDIYNGTLKRPAEIPEIASLHIPSSIAAQNKFRFAPPLMRNPDGKMTICDETDDFVGGNILPEVTPTTVVHRAPPLVNPPSYDTVPHAPSATIMSPNIGFPVTPYLFQRSVTSTTLEHGRVIAAERNGSSYVAPITPPSYYATYPHLDRAQPHFHANMMRHQAPH